MGAEQEGQRHGPKKSKGREFLAKSRRSGMVVDHPTPEFTAVMLTLPDRLRGFTVHPLYGVDDANQEVGVEEVVVIFPDRDRRVWENAFDQAVAFAWDVISKYQTNGTRRRRDRLSFTTLERNVLKKYKSMRAKVANDLETYSPQDTEVTAPRRRTLRTV